MKALIARKLGMSSAIAEDGAAIAITLLSAEPNVVTQVKSSETDGYQAVQLGTKSTKKLSKPQTGHAKAAKTSPRKLREFRVRELPEGLAVGDKVGPDVFDIGDTVDVTGISKGKGFAGVIKRHRFKLGRKTHGGRSYRRPGSIGSMYPQRIFPGKKMAGHMGNEQVTVKRLKIALIDPELNVIGVTGAVPGPKKGLVFVKEAK
ncbi:MAG: 50S ribosomal protein L3 [Candidatus Saccharimonadales bacterium]